MECVVFAETTDAATMELPIKHRGFRHLFGQYSWAFSLQKDHHNAVQRSRNALLTTDNELRLMATLAQTGEISRPSNG
jgi:hypothetical protein